MATISKFIISNAKPIDSTNWLTIQDVFGPKDVPDPSPRGDCVVQAFTSPQNNEAEWSQIAWTGGDSLQGKPNVRRIKRNSPGVTTITASIGTSTQTCVLWTMWATVTVLTSGPRPSRANPWGTGELVQGPDQCGAYEIDSASMTKTVRGQIIAVAKLSPKGVGKMLSFGGKNMLLNLRREVASVYYTQGVLFTKQSHFDWKDDKFQGIQVAYPDTDQVYDTDAPDLPQSVNSSETYANFRQWLELDKQPCSNYAPWYFQARWKNQVVTFKDLGAGSMPLPHQPFYKKP